MHETQHPSGDGAGAGDPGPGQELETRVTSGDTPDTVMARVMESLNRPDFGGMTRAEISQFWDEAGHFMANWGLVFPREVLWLLVKARQAADEASGASAARQEIAELKQQDQAALEQGGWEEERGELSKCHHRETPTAAGSDGAAGRHCA